MPKERIYGNSSSDPATCRDVVVHWSKATPTHERDQDGFAGAVYVDVVGQTEDNPVELALLGRTAINRLIQTLRRARDAAYGTDA